MINHAVRLIPPFVGWLCLTAAARAGTEQIHPHGPPHPAVVHAGLAHAAAHQLVGIAAGPTVAVSVRTGGFGREATDHRREARLRRERVKADLEPGH